MIILVIEPDKALREILSHYLTSTATIYLLGSVNQAVILIRETGIVPKVTLFDCALNNSELEEFENLRMDTDMGHIVLFTARSDYSDLQSKYKFNKVIRKPFDISELDNLL